MRFAPCLQACPSAPHVGKPDADISAKQRSGRLTSSTLVRFPSCWRPNVPQVPTVFSAGRFYRRPRNRTRADRDHSVRSRRTRLQDHQRIGARDEQEPEHSTLGDSLNRGAELATGAYIAKVDDDDLYGNAYFDNLCSQSTQRERTSAASRLTYSISRPPTPCFVTRATTIDSELRLRLDASDEAQSSSRFSSHPDGSVRTLGSSTERGRWFHHLFCGQVQLHLDTTSRPREPYGQVGADELLKQFECAGSQWRRKRRFLHLS